MYKINADNYDKIQLTQQSLDDGELFLVLKGIMGLGQKHGAYVIKRTSNSNNYFKFHAKHCDKVLHKNITKTANLSPVSHVDTECFIDEPHTMHIEQNVYFFSNTPILPLLETIFIKIVKTSTKRFISFLEAM
jgi:hypothetical protein